MCSSYLSGETEREQMQGVATMIREIGKEIAPGAPTSDYWKTIVRWELLERACVLRTRGHARHVVNVFWLGFLLINHCSTRDRFEKLARESLETRAPKESSLSPLEALNDIWFLTALFHDLGAPVEATRRVREAHNKVIDDFSIDPDHSNEFLVPDPNGLNIGVLQTRVKEIFPRRDRPGDATRNMMSDALLRSARDVGIIDHGVVSALRLLDDSEHLMSHCARWRFREAAQSIALHNILKNTPPDARIYWNDDLCGCLLVICDQIQAWERERNDESIFDNGHCQTAELIEFTISDESPPSVHMTIDYLAPRHIRTSSKFLSNERECLSEAINNHPRSALLRLAGTSPFSLLARISLNKREVTTLEYCAR
jgi:hypothetical protein